MTRPEAMRMLVRLAERVAREAGVRVRVEEISGNIVAISCRHIEDGIQRGSDMAISWVFMERLRPECEQLFEREIYFQILSTAWDVKPPKVAA